MLLLLLLALRLVLLMLLLLLLMPIRSATLSALWLTSPSALKLATRLARKLAIMSAL